DAGVAAKILECLDRIDLGELSSWRFAIEPGEKTRHGCSVPQMRRARTGDLDGILDRLHDGDRIGAARCLASGCVDDALDCIGGARLVEAHGLMRLAERREIAHERIGLAHSGELLELMTHVVRELAAVDIDRRTACLWDDGRSERYRRMRNVAAADI